MKYIDIIKRKEKYDFDLENLKSNFDNNISSAKIRKEKYEKTILYVAIGIGLVFLFLTIFLFNANFSTTYITNTGSKYHLGSCHYLEYSKIKTTVASAKARGFDRCSRCSGMIFLYSLLIGGAVGVISYFLLLTKSDNREIRVNSNYLQNKKNIERLYLKDLKELLIPGFIDSSQFSLAEKNKIDKIIKELSDINTDKEMELKIIADQADNKQKLLNKKKAEQRKRRPIVIKATIKLIFLMPFSLISFVINVISGFLYSVVFYLFIAPAKNLTNSDNLAVGILLFIPMMFIDAFLIPFSLLSSFFCVLTVFLSELYETGKYCHSLKESYLKHFENRKEYFEEFLALLNKVC